MQRYGRPAQVTIGSAIRKLAAAPMAGRAGGTLGPHRLPGLHHQNSIGPRRRVMPAIHWGFMTRQDESGNGSTGQPPPWAVLTAEEFATCQLEWAAAEPPPARRGRPSPPGGERSAAGPAAAPWNVVALGDCRDVLPMVRSESVDTIFADPPYNLQLKKALIRPNRTLVESVDADVGSVQHLSRIRPIHLPVAPGVPAAC